MAALSLIFDIIGKDHASKELDKVGGAAERTGGRLTGLGKTAAVAMGGVALGGITAFTAGLVGGFKEAVSYQKITDQLAQTLKATGGVAGVSVDGLKKYAGQLESMSGVDEELILSSQNVLATFTQIQNKTGKGNDIFNQASLAALNLSTTLGTDVGGAAVQVGKALNDPIKGITALGKAGVSFTQQQKDQIKTLVKSGDTLGAQKIILGELNKEFGGAAAAAGKGFGGTMARLKDTVSDAFRDIATRALPTITKLAEGLAQVLPKAIAVVSGALGKVSSVASQVFGILFQGDFKGGILSEDSKIVDVIFRIRDGLITFGKAAIDAVQNKLIPAFKNLVAILTPTLMEAWAVAAQGAGLLMGAFSAILRVLVPVTNFLREHKTAVQALVVVVGTAVAVYKAYQAVQFLIATATKAWAAAQAALNIVMSANPIGLVVIAIAALAAGLIYAYKHSETFRNGVNAVFDGLKSAFGWVKDHWPLILAILTGPFGLAVVAIVKHRDTIVHAIKNIPSLLKKAFTGIVSLITSPFITAFNFIAKAFNDTIGKIHFNIPHVGGFDVPNIPLIGGGGGGTSEGSPGATRVPGGGRLGEADSHIGGLNIHGDVIVQAKESPAPDAFVRRMSNLAFTAGF